MPDYSLYNSSTTGLRPWEELLSPAPPRWSPLAETLFPGATRSPRSLGDVLLGLTGGAPSVPPPESMAPAAIGPGRMSPAYSARVYDTDPNATLQAYSPSLWEEIRQSNFGRRMFGEPNAVLDGPGRRGVVGVVGGIVGEPARAAGKLSKGAVADLANGVAGGEFGGNTRTALKNIGRRPEDQAPMRIDQAMALARQQEVDNGDWGASTVAGNIALGLAESAPKIALMPAGGGWLTQAGMNTALFGLDDGGVLDARGAATGLLLPGVSRLTGALAKQGIKSGVAAGANWLANPAVQKALHVAANQAGVNTVMLAQDAGDLGRLSEVDPQGVSRLLAETVGSNLAFVPWELRTQRRMVTRESPVVAAVAGRPLEAKSLGDLIKTLSEKVTGSGGVTQGVKAAMEYLRAQTPMFDDEVVHPESLRETGESSPPQPSQEHSPLADLFYKEANRAPGKFIELAEAEMARAAAQSDMVKQPVEFPETANLTRPIANAGKLMSPFFEGDATWGQAVNEALRIYSQGGTITEAINGTLPALRRKYGALAMDEETVRGALMQAVSEASGQTNLLRWHGLENSGGYEVFRSPDNWNVMKTDRGWQLYGPDGLTKGMAATPQEAFGLAERLARREPVGFRAGVAPQRVQTIDQVTNRREFEIPEYGQLIRTIHRVADAFGVPVEALTPIFGGWYDTERKVQSREISARVHLPRGSDPRLVAAAAAVMGTLAPHLQNSVMILNYDAPREQMNHYEFTFRVKSDYHANAVAQALTSQGFGAYSYDGNVRRFIMVRGSANLTDFDLVTRDLADKGWLVPGSRKRVRANVEFPGTEEFLGITEEGMATIQPKASEKLGEIGVEAFRRLNQGDR